MGISDMCAVAAAASNVSVVASLGTPALLGIAGVSALASAVTFGLADAALKQYCSSLAGSGKHCEGQCGSLDGTLKALAAVMGVDATACFSAAGISWIPFAGLVPIQAIFGAKVSAGTLAASSFYLFKQVVRCANQAVGPVEPEPAAVK
jgi:hypothetical protein